jgi:sec-independent protein translocase protein TatC
MEDKDESLITHLEALRTVLLKCLIALGVGLVPAFAASPYIMDWLIKTVVGGIDVHLNYFSPMEVFILQIKIAALLDLLVCFPYIARQAWLFVLPALYDNERKFIRSLSLISAAVFAAGVLFCLFFIAPLIIKFGISFATPDIKAVLGVSNVVGLVLMLSLIFGLMFQFPLIAYLLVRLGVVSYDSVKNKRPYVFIGVLVVSGIVTPPDVVSQVMLTVPTYLLFELGLLAARKYK